MNYVAQKENFGCVVACGAMVFNLSYEQARMYIPPPRREDLQNLEELNELNALVLERLQSLSNLTGNEMSALDGPPYELKEGSRYILWLETDEPNVLHSVAVDETGIVFNPDPNEQDVRKRWTEYRIKAALEFRPTK